MFITFNFVIIRPVTDFLWHFNIVQDRNTYVTVATSLQTEFKGQIHHVHSFIFEVKQTVPVKFIKQNGEISANEIILGWRNDERLGK